MSTDETKTATKKVAEKPKKETKKSAPANVADHDQWCYFKDGTSKMVKAGESIPADAKDSPAGFEK